MAENPSHSETKEKNRDWLLPSAKALSLPAGLYLVATPIGNLGDMSLRALDTLNAVDGILCEDTRVTGKLLSHFDLKKPLHVYNDHSDDVQRKKILKRIDGGEALALVSDAGMPLVSDPGYKLVHAVQQAGLSVTSIPGANAPLTALQLSGLPSDAFSFVGFFPPKSSGRRSVLEKWKDAPGTLLAFETGPRLLSALEDIEAVMSAREVAVTRELTKLHEEVRKGRARDLISHYTDNGSPKGEIVIVIAPPAAPYYREEELEEMLKGALESMTTKDAAAHLAAKTGLSKKMLYEMALEIGSS